MPASRRPSILAVAAFALLTAAAPGARGDADEEWIAFPAAAAAGGGSVAHGNAARVRRQTGTRAGLEAGMPRDGAYARGILLDARGQHVEALREYAAALAELDSLAAVAQSPDARFLSWRAKVAWQREQSEELLERDAYAAVMPGSVIAHYNLGATLHAKFLSVRAFLGRGPKLLWNGAMAEYREALRIDPRFSPARLGAAALYADAGLFEPARAEFAQVGRRRDEDDFAMRVAAYYASIGEADEAFAYLARAVTRLDQIRWALRSNDFDALRTDERFARLVGKPYEQLLRAEEDEDGDE